MKRMHGENHYLLCTSENCDFAPCVGRRDLQGRINKLEKRLRSYTDIAPKVLERLKTYSDNSHFGSVSESVYLDFCKVMELKK